ncbi:molybdenum cofactor sulfurase-like [Penaeus chinensis]|uniref:molybdenum cofactor sulfurase-like n=1 Tax=Penaeus chinensis TaxID=139456 RepID=UPI001FB71935|nr:molybdenum cofactor sulfurase-like [Penaeus chinensis]
MAAVLEKLKVPPNYDLERIIKEDFDRLKGHYYLDHAAATLYSDSQIQAASAELQHSLLGNPHSRSFVSDAATRIVESVRQRILDHFNTTADEYDVIFTSGATQALKIVAEHFNWHGSEETRVENEDNSTSENNPELTVHQENDHISSRTVQEEALGCHREDETRGAFVYAMENHTSVLGMRGPAAANGADIYCLQTEQLLQMLEKCKTFPSKTNFNHTDAREKENDVRAPNGNRKKKRHCLFAYSAQCNFSGVKSPLVWIDKVQKGALDAVLKQEPVNKNNAHLPENTADDCSWYVVLDAAGFTATCSLDLSQWKPDFVPVSFYKIFGYPTGLGCLLVHQRAWTVLGKSYFGGGSVLMIDSRRIVAVPRPVLHDKFEDGTLAFLSLPAVRHGLDTIEKHTGGMKNIQQHVFNLARYTHHSLRSFRHGNGAPVVETYPKDANWDVRTQGSIVNFSILKSDGSYIGYSQVEKFASLYNIHLRTGCLCNPGACQKYLNISEETLIQQFKAGHVCGDAHDLVEGLPTGSVRISFGYMSSYRDADQLLQMVKECFVEGSLIIDSSWIEVQPCLAEKESYHMRGQIELGKKELLNGNEKRFDSNESTVRTKNGHLDSDITNTPLQVQNERNMSSAPPLKLTNIILYPVKSCSGISVREWSIGEEGLKYDRQWMIVTNSGTTLTQKRLPIMSLIKPNIDLVNGVLQLSFKGESIAVPLEPQECSTRDASLCRGVVCGDRIRGHDCGPEVGAWLSRVLQQPDLKLMQQLNKRTGKLDSKGNGSLGESLSFANESQYLVIHRASVRKLLKDISEKGLANLTEDELVTRFRANLVLDGGEPYEEDSWEELLLDKIRFKVQGGCNRCQMVGVIPETGERMKEPMITLAATRGSYMNFGIHAAAISSVSNNETISVRSRVSCI